jgi:WD40 repeat protein
METGAGLGGEIDYFTVSPDWKTIYALTKHRGRKRETLQTEGRQFWRWSFDDAVQVFDVESGKLTGSWQHTPAREIRTLTFSPNGAYFVTADGVPGIYEDQYKRTMSLWNTQTGSHQDLDDRYDNSSVLFSPDGKQIALTTKADDYDRTITIVDAADLQPRTVILLPPGYVRAWPCAFCMGGAICAVRTTIYRFENDLGSSSTALRFYDVKTGAEVFQAPAPKKGESFYPVALSADGNTLAAVIWELNESPGQLLLVSAGSWKSQFIELGQHVGVGGLAFHPKGKWLAVGVQVGQANPPPSFVPQSQIRIVDVASGKTLETLAMPPCYPQAVAFSPDGKTLATSGQGEVLLWDFSKPPGEK